MFFDSWAALVRVLVVGPLAAVRATLAAVQGSA
jgi:hypothetical protein